MAGGTRENLRDAQPLGAKRRVWLLPMRIDVRVPLKQRDATVLRAQLAGSRHPLRPHVQTFRLRDDGRLVARLTTSIPFETLPTLHGRLVDTPHGPELTGYVRESRSGVCILACFWLVAVTALAGTVALLLTGQLAGPPLPIAAVTTLVIGALAFQLSRTRRRDFTEAAAELRSQLGVGLRTLHRGQKQCS